MVIVTTITKIKTNSNKNKNKEKKIFHNNKTTSPVKTQNPKILAIKLPRNFLKR